MLCEVDYGVWQSSDEDDVYEAEMFPHAVKD